MKMGHCKGTKREKPGASDWYHQTEQETLRQLEAEAAAKQEEQDAA